MMKRSANIIIAALVATAIGRFQILSLLFAFLLLPSLVLGAPTQFIESGTSATNGFEFWASTTTSNNGAVTSDTGVTFTGGPRSIKSNSGTPVAGNAFVSSPLSIFSGGVGRLTFGFRVAAFSILGKGIFLGLVDSGSVVNLQLGVTSAGVLTLYDDTGTSVATGSTISAATKYRITFSLTITSTTVNEFRVFLDDSTTAALTASNVTILSGVSGFTLGNTETDVTLSTIYNFGNIYVDNGTTLDNISINGLYVTSKRPATENTTSFDTAIGNARSASDFNNVNERPLSETNGWQHAATSDVQENYGLETAAAGDVDLTGKTLIARTAWVWAKRGAAANGSSTIDTHLRFTASTSPVTSAYTAAATAKAVLLTIVIGGNVTRAGGAPTYNAVAMTQAGSPQTATETGVEVWYLLGTNDGASHTISVPNTGSKTLFIEASSFIPPTGATGFTFDSGTIQQTVDTAGSANPTQTIVPTKGGSVVINVLGDGLTSVPTTNSHTLLSKTDDGNFTDSHQYLLQGAAASVNVGWTVGSDDWAMITAAFIPNVDLYTLGTPKIMDNGSETAITLTTTSALYKVITDSASYPSNAAGIGMRSSAATPDTFFYEGGTLIAYEDTPPPSACLKFFTLLGVGC